MSAPKRILAIGAALGEFATPDAIASFRTKLGLDEPLWAQYVSFVRHALMADCGRSMSNSAPINGLLAQALPYTLSLAGAATLIGSVVGIPLGALTAVQRNGVADGFLNKLLLVIAVAFGTINVVGGFLVTDRMLGMFKAKPEEPKREE